MPTGSSGEEGHISKVTGEKEKSSKVNIKELTGNIMQGTSITPGAGVTSGAGIMPGAGIYIPDDFPGANDESFFGLSEGLGVSNTQSQRRASTTSVDEQKYDIMGSISPEDRKLITFSPHQGENVFMKMRFSYDGSRPLETFITEIAGMAIALSVRTICFKSILFQSFKPPVSYVISDMQPSLPDFRKLTKKEYVNALSERIEPASTRDLVGIQYLARKQQAGENIFYYLSCKQNLYKRAYPGLETRIFRDLREQLIRGLSNEILRARVRDVCSQNEINDFGMFVTMVRSQVDSIRSRVLAGELTAEEAQGTEVDLTAVSESAGTPNSTDNKINVLEESSLNAVHSRYKTRDRSDPQARYKARDVSDKTCFHCGSASHFVRDCPRFKAAMPKSQFNRINEIGDYSDNSDEEYESCLNAFKRNFHEKKYKDRKWQDKAADNIEEKWKKTDEKINALEVNVDKMIASMAKMLGNEKIAKSKDSVNGISYPSNLTDPWDSQDENAFLG